MAFFEHDFTITMRDVDKNIKLTDKSILGFFEDIAGFHSDKVGYGLKSVSSTRLSWVLLHWKVKVIKRPEYSDIIHIRTWSRYSKKVYSYRDFEMYNSNNELIAIGTSKWSLINIDKGLTKIEDSLIEKYTPENKSVFDIVELPKLKEPNENLKHTYNYIVSKSDIDINNHMHNLNYLDIAYNSLPNELEIDADFNNIEIMYKHGAYLNDYLNCFYTCIDNEHYIIIKNNDNSDLHAIVKFS